MKEQSKNLKQEKKVDYKHLQHDIRMVFFDNFMLTVELAEQHADQVIEKIQNFYELPDSLPYKLTYCNKGKHLFPTQKEISINNHASYIKRFCKEHFDEENVYTDIWNLKELYDILGKIEENLE